MQNQEISSIYEKLQAIRNKLSQAEFSVDDNRDGLLKQIDDLENLFSDISEHSPELDFSETEKKFQLLFEHTPVGILQFNKKGVITACNRVFVDILGSSKKKLIGLDMTSLPNKKIVATIQQALQGETSTFQGNYTSVTGNKTSRIKAIFSPVIGQNRDVLGGVGIVEDITRQHLRDKALKESEFRYRKVFRDNYSVMMVIDPADGSIIDVNKAAERYYGWPLEEFLKKNIKEINTLPNDVVQKEMEKAKTGLQNTFHFRHRLASGSVRVVEVHSSVIPIDGKKFLYSVIYDITARMKAVKSLKKFRLGIDRSPNAIFITDVNGSINYVNPAFEQLYGYKAGEVMGKNPRILKSGEQPETFYKDFWETILEGDVVRGEMINKTKDGRLLNIHFSSNPIINDEDEIIGFIAIQEDITGLKKMEKSLRESLYEKEIMLAEIHHRVKNNLAMISAMMIIQADKTDDPGLSNKLLDSTNRIKAIANIHEHLYESTNLSLIHFTDNIINLIEKISDTLQTETDISIVKQCKDCNEIEMDINQAIYCSLIVNEVVTNIIKHAFNGLDNGKIEISAKEEQNTVILEITDNGHKIPENFQDSNANSLGMDLIHIFSRQLDGSFKYIPKEKGTTFTLTFRKKERKHNRFEVEGKMPYH